MTQSVLSKSLFWSVSGAWSALSASARYFAREGWVKRDRLDVTRVISVGNIQVGGAGKTPLAALIAREAHERGLKTCLLCRGYGSAWEVSGGVIGPGEKCPDTGACGDEAALLHELAPHAWIGVGADRARQFEQVVARAGTKPDLAVLDDGFQNWKIHKDLEIVALTSTPRTQVLYRDAWRSLEFADLLVWTKGDVALKELPRKPCVRVKFLLPKATRSISICLVTGLGDGAEAARCAMDAGYEIKQHLSFPDHARYEKEMVHRILKEASGTGWGVALSGKDWVKWRELDVRAEQVIVLEPEIVFLEEPEGRAVWNRILWGG